MAPYAGHSALEPAGANAAQILRLFYQYLDVSAVVFTLVIAALGFALGRKPDARAERLEPSDAAQRSRRRAVSWATAATVCILLGLLIASVATGHALAVLPANHPLRVRVIAHKFWWEFRYPVSGPASQFSTAYELHVPAGRPVELELVATDVIHSFWVPSLGGKRDAIPGKRQVLLIQADKPGAYEGQCAEFCGTQHANMRFLVIAERPSQFAAWRDHQLSSPTAPADPIRQQGLKVFMSSRCSSCHAISGTEAFGTVGPDLTHLASRRRLAMGRLANDPTHLSQWIDDPQLLKPGVQMPSTPLRDADRQALLAYLGGLE
ncbi:MAG TPA: cytochrome c oxidase subunit II [Polyangiaceae bacterium]|nr:cytochrome c oxidase subunit II [Polyangiaceae bacterium]